MDVLKAPWIQNILNPLPVGEPGDDPKHEEDFCKIKQEVEKLSDIDFEKIKALSIRLLSDKTKDLRVAGYLLLACSYLDDLETVIHVLFVYEGLVKRYWNSIHPQKALPKMAAIDWLNNERLAGFIITKLDNVDKKLIHVLLEHVNSLNESLVEQGGETVAQYNRLKKVLKEQAVDIVVSSKVVQALPELPKKPRENPNFFLQSREDVEVATRSIIEYFNKNGQKLYAASFARALKWSALNPSATSDNKTVFAPPCETDKKELKWTMEKEDPKELYRICEKQFLRVGGHVNFDLQYYACKAAMEMGEKLLAQYLELESKSLITRVPQLMSLLYRDGSPFVTEKTREWLMDSAEIPKEQKHEKISKTTSMPIQSEFLDKVGEELNNLSESDQVSFERKLAKSILFLTATMM